MAQNIYGNDMWLPPTASSLTAYGTPGSGPPLETANKIAELSRPRYSSTEGVLSAIAKLRDLSARAPGHTPPAFLPPPTPTDQWRNFMNMMRGEASNNLQEDPLQQVLVEREFADSAMSGRHNIPPPPNASPTVSIGRRTNPMISSQFPTVDRTNPFGTGGGTARQTGIPDPLAPFRY